MDQCALTPATAGTTDQAIKSTSSAARQLFAGASRLSSNDLSAPFALVGETYTAQAFITEAPLSPKHSPPALATHAGDGSSQGHWEVDTAAYPGHQQFAFSAPLADCSAEDAAAASVNQSGLWQGPWQSPLMLNPVQPPTSEQHRVSASCSSSTGASVATTAAAEMAASGPGAAVAASAAPASALGADLLMSHSFGVQAQQPQDLLQHVDALGGTANTAGLEETFLKLSCLSGVPMPVSPGGIAPGTYFNAALSTSSSAAELGPTRFTPSAQDQPLLRHSNPQLNLLNPAVVASMASIAASRTNSPATIGGYPKPVMLQSEAVGPTAMQHLLGASNADLAAVLAAGEGGFAAAPGQSPLVKAYVPSGPVAPSACIDALLSEATGGVQLPLGGLAGDPCGSPNSPWANWSVDSSGERTPFSPARGSPVRGSTLQHMHLQQQQHLADIGRPGSFTGSHCNSPCGYWSDLGEAESAANSPMHVSAAPHADLAALYGDASGLGAAWRGGADAALLQGTYGGDPVAAAAAAGLGNPALAGLCNANLMGASPSMLQASLIGAQAAKAALEAKLKLQLQLQMHMLQNQALQQAIQAQTQQVLHQESPYSPQAFARAGLRGMGAQPSRIYLKEQAAAGHSAHANLYASTLQHQMELPRINTGARRPGWGAARKATPKAPVQQQMLSDEELQEKKEQRRQRYKEKIAKLRVQLAGRAPRAGLCMFGLGHLMVEERLREWFKDFSPGEIHVDMRSGRCKGLATMTLPSVAHATAALKAFDGCDAPGLVEFQGCGAPLIVYDHGKQDKSPPGISAPQAAVAAGGSRLQVCAGGQAERELGQAAAAAVGAAASTAAVPHGEGGREVEAAPHMVAE